MRRMDKSWMALVAAALLLGTLVGVVWARPNDRAQGADGTRKVALTGADFSCVGDPSDCNNSGGHVSCSAGICVLTAPIVFPCLPAVTVEHIKLHVEDLDATEAAAASIYRVKPPTGVQDWWAAVSSPTGLSDGVETYASPAINKVVRPSQKAFIMLNIQAPNIYVWGVTVEYHQNI